MVKLALTLACVIGAPAPAHGEDALRGGMLYEARCGACHSTSVHARKARKATSFEGLRTQVIRWNVELGGGWSADEINDVTVYLNNRYYSFRCPESVCRSGQAKSEAGRSLARLRVERR